MKKLLMFLLLASPAVFATPQQELTDRLAKVRGFTANFDQVVTSPDGKEISKGEGNVALKRPNLFHWKTKTPDETVLISDGITLWYYSPFIEQVTAMWLSEATEQTPFVLLTRNTPSDWTNFNVQQDGDVFTLTPKADSVMGTFEVEVAKNGQLIDFSVIEKDGQKSHFTLDEFKITNPASDMFKFTLPDGVELDDQRQK